MTLFGDNANTTRTYGWQPEPPLRGTWSILSSCLATMTLCIWTSLHLHIPGKGEGFLTAFTRKTGWLICGLFAPELVVWTAFQQLRDARSLTKKMNKLLSAKKPPQRLGFWARLSDRVKCNKKWETESAKNKDVEMEEPQRIETDTEFRRHPWTIVHSHYVLMGGFAFDVSTLSQNVMPCNLQRLSLTYGGAVFLAIANPAAVPNISAEKILDKSKASGLAKMIVCLQAAWFCTQCLVRMGQGLGISLLELNTFAHAICALLIFILWWNKPLDIEEPTEIQSPDAAELCATFITSDVLGVRHPNNVVIPQALWKARPGWLLRRPQGSAYLVRSDEIADAAEITPQPRGILLGDWRITMCDLLPKAYRVDRFNNRVQGEEVDKRIASGDSLAGLTFKAVDGVGEPHEARLELAELEVSCLHLGWQGLVAHQDSRAVARELQKRLSGNNSKKKEEDGTETLLCARVSNWPALGRADQNGVHLHRSSLLVGFTIAGLVYGGMHILAWTASFASAAEQTLWRGSTVVLLVSGFLLLFSKVFAWSDSFLLLQALVYAILMFLAVFYILARACLVVECFLELHHLPAQVFETPSWSKYWPHIA